MRTTSFADPGDKLLAEDTSRDQEELQPEPVIAEPQKKIRAENDRKGAETENPLIATQPADQHVKDIHKYDLSGDERRVMIDLAPVPAPVEVNTGVHHQLDIVDWPGQEFVTDL